MKLLISIFLMMFSVAELSAIELSKENIKRINKVVQKELGIDDVNFTAVQLNETERHKLTWQFDANSLYRISTNDKLLGFLVIDQAKGRHDHFDFMILYDAELQLKHIEIITYRSQHGGQICSKNWLKSFEGKPAGYQYTLAKEVDAISGATLSTNGLVNAVNKIGNSLIEIDEISSSPVRVTTTSNRPTSGADADTAK